MIMPQQVHGIESQGEGWGSGGKVRVNTPLLVKGQGEG